MELSAAALVVAYVVVLGGALVRGFTGFGASLIWISGLTLLMEPDEAVPIIFCLEVLVSAQLLPRARHDVDWPVVRRLLLGVVVGMPAGAALLLVLDADPMRLVVSVIVLVSAVLLGVGASIPLGSGPGSTVATGVVSGVLNGAAATGGPPVIILLLGSSAGMAVSRASLIAFFGATDIIGIGIVAVAGLLDPTALIRTVAFAPAMLVGATLGARGLGGERRDRPPRCARGARRARPRGDRHRPLTRTGYRLTDGATDSRHHPGHRRGGRDRRP